MRQTTVMENLDTLRLRVGHLEDEKIREGEEKSKIKKVEGLRQLIEELTSERNHNGEMRIVIEELKADRDQKLETLEDCLAEVSPVWKMLRIRELFREHIICQHNKFISL